MRLLAFLVLGMFFSGCGDTDRNKTVFMPSATRAVFAPTDTTAIPPTGTTIVPQTPLGGSPEGKMQYQEIWGNSTFLICRSDVMSTGKYLRAIIEQSTEGLRHYTVNLMLDDQRLQIFEAYQKPEDVNSPILVSIDEVVKAAYGLGFDALYQMTFNANNLTLSVVNGKDVHASSALGIPPASCSVMRTAN